MRLRGIALHTSTSPTRCAWCSSLVACSAPGSSGAAAAPIRRGELGCAASLYDFAASSDELLSVS